MIEEHRQAALAADLKRIQSKVKDLERRRAYQKTPKELKRRREAWRRKHGKGIGKGGTQLKRAFPVINDKREWFASAKKAADHYGVTKYAIHYAIQNPNRTSCGLRWGYEMDGRPDVWDEPAELYPTRFKIGNTESLKAYLLRNTNPNT